MNFKGYDWTEIAEALKFHLEDPDNAQPLEYYILENWQQDSNIVEQCRAYLCVLSGHDTYESPLWTGLSKIQDDGTFISYFTLLLDGMWT